MKASEIYLVPGEHAVQLALEILKVPAEDFNPTLMMVLAALVSWLFWVAALRLIGTLSLRILGLDRPER